MVRWKKTADTTWIVAGPLDNDAQSFLTPVLASATEYEFQLALRTEKGREGAYSTSTVATSP
jgi:hypothetical protein